MFECWETPTIYECIARIDTDDVEGSLVEGEAYPEAEEILAFMRDYVVAHTTVNPNGQMEEYQIPGHWEATDGKLDLYKDENDYYLIKKVS